MVQIIIGFFSGIISGMGIGGGAILIPALTLFQGIGQQVAQGINLVYFLPTAIASLFIHIKNRNVELKTAAIIGCAGIFAAACGAYLATQMSADVLRRLFGVFLSLIGVYEIIKGVRMKRNIRS